MIKVKRMLVGAACFSLVLLISGCGGAKIDAKNAQSFAESVREIGQSLEEKKRIRFAQDIYVLYKSAIEKEKLRVSDLFSENHEDLYSYGFRIYNSGGYSEIVQAIGDQIDKKSAEDIYSLAGTIRREVAGIFLEEYYSNIKAIDESISRKESIKSKKGAWLKENEAKHNTYLSAVNEGLQDLNIERLKYRKNGVYHFYLIEGTASISNTLNRFPKLTNQSVCGLELSIKNSGGHRISNEWIKFSEIKPGQTQEKVRISFEKRTLSRLVAKKASEVSLEFTGTFSKCERYRRGIRLPSTRVLSNEKNRLNNTIGRCNREIQLLSNQKEKLILAIEKLNNFEVTPFSMTKFPKINNYQATSMCK